MRMKAAPSRELDPTEWPPGFRPGRANLDRSAHAAIGSESRRVLAEDVAHRAADLTERAAVLQCRSDRREQVGRAARGLAQLLEALLDERLVAVDLERAQALDLQALGLGIDAKQVGDLRVLLLIGVHADNDVLADA